MNENAWRRFCNPKPGESLEECEKRLAIARLPENTFPTESQRLEIDSRKIEWHRKDE